jgi:low temperature requirement protein LtrA
VSIQLGRTAFVRIALGGTHPLSRNFQRVLAWYAVSGALWIMGWLSGKRGPLRAVGARGFGHTRTGEWTIEGGHFAERCQHSVIISLGESLLVTGTTFGEIEASTVTIAAFVLAFLGSMTLWWIYFSRSAEVAREIISSSEDPGRFGSSAYTYFHIPMIAGIIAASDELTVAHPGDPERSLQSH